MANDIAILRRTLARETSSLLQYLRSAWPWTPPGEQAAWDELRRLVDEDQEALRPIADYLAKNHVVPISPSFPEEFTSINYIGLDRLLPWLVNYQAWLIEQMEKDREDLESEETRSLLGSVLETKRRHLSELQKLAASNADKVASTVR